MSIVPRQESSLFETIVTGSSGYVYIYIYIYSGRVIRPRNKDVRISIRKIAKGVSCVSSHG